MGKCFWQTLSSVIFIVATDVNHHAEYCKKNKCIRRPEEPAKISDAHKFADEITNDSTDDKKRANASED
jgi:hypothetical protein